MNTITILFAIPLALFGLVYILLSRAVNKNAIVNINGIVYAFKKNPTIMPTLIGLGIIALVLIALSFTCADCLTYTR